MIKANHKFKCRLQNFFTGKCSYPVFSSSLEERLDDPSQNRHLILNDLLLLYMDVCIRSSELSLGLPSMRVVPVLSEKHNGKTVVLSESRNRASR